MLSQQNTACCAYTMNKSASILELTCIKIASLILIQGYLVHLGNELNSSASLKCAISQKLLLGD